MADSHEQAMSTGEAPQAQAPLDTSAQQQTTPMAAASTKTAVAVVAVTSAGASATTLSATSTTSTPPLTTKPAFVPFQSPRSTHSAYISSSSIFARDSYHHSGGGSGGGGGTGRSSASSAAAASAAALQLQRELDLQHEAVSRRPQLVQDIAVTKEPSNLPTFRDYGPTTRDWTRRDSSLERERRDRSRERERYGQESYRYGGGSSHRRDYSRERDRERDPYRDRYRDHSRERGGRDTDYRSEVSSRRYRESYRYHEGFRDERDYRDYRHERYYRKERDGRDGARDYDYEDPDPRSRRYDGEHSEERDSRHRNYRRDTERDYDRDRYREWDRVSEHDLDRRPQEQQREVDQGRAKDTDEIEKVALEDHDYQPLHRPSRDLTILEPKVEPWHLSKEQIAAQTAAAAAALAAATMKTATTATIATTAETEEAASSKTSIIPSTASVAGMPTANTSANTVNVRSSKLPFAPDKLDELGATRGSTTSQPADTHTSPTDELGKGLTKSDKAADVSVVNTTKSPPFSPIPTHPLELGLPTVATEQAQSHSSDTVMKSPEKDMAGKIVAQITENGSLMPPDSTSMSEIIPTGPAVSALVDDDDDLDAIPKGPRNQESRSSWHWESQERDGGRKYADDRDYYYHSRRHGYSSSHRHYDYYDKYEKYDRYDKYHDRGALRSSRGSPPPPPSSMSHAVHSETSSTISSPPPSSNYPPTHHAPPPARRSTVDDDYYGYHRDHGRDYAKDRDRERERERDRDRDRDHHYRQSWHSSSSYYRERYRDPENGRYESSSSRRAYDPWPDSHKRPLSPEGRRDRYDYDSYDASRKGPIPDYPESHVPEYQCSPSMMDPMAPTAASEPGAGYNIGPGPHASHSRPMTPAIPSLQKVDDLYERVGQVGEGTYGKVYKARNKQTGEFVALKRIRMEAEKDGFPITAMREIKLLQALNHRHVVSLRELMVSKGAVYMVLEYMDHDLTGILGHPHLRFKPEHIKCLLRQLLEGLGFLHHKGVLHRDMKGSNLLVNRHGELKLTDFGLARLFQKKARRDYTNRVITLWYRPPELLLGATAYGPEVDMWSAGCIMVELFSRKPIFTGQNEISQLDNIWKVMGTPRIETWPELTDLQWFDLLNPLKGEARASKFRDIYGKLMSPAALDLAEALLCLNPKKRPSASEALKFPYFTEEQPPACLPEELPKIEGDWHEYESKQRKKINSKVKQQPASQPAKKDALKGDSLDHVQAQGATSDKIFRAGLSAPTSDSTPRPPPESQAPTSAGAMSNAVRTERGSSSEYHPPSFASATSGAPEHQDIELPRPLQQTQPSSITPSASEHPSVPASTSHVTAAAALPSNHPLVPPRNVDILVPPPPPPPTAPQAPSSLTTSGQDPSTSLQQSQGNRAAPTSSTTAPVVSVPTAGYNGITYEIPAYSFLGGERSAPVTARDRYYERGGRRDYSRDRDRDRDRDYGDYRSSRGGRDRYYDYERDYDRGSSSSRHRDWSRERYGDRERDRDYHRERDRGRDREYHRDRDREYSRGDRERDRERSAREHEYDWYREEYYHKSAGVHDHPPTAVSVTAAIPTGPSADDKSSNPTSTAVVEARAGGGVAADGLAAQASGDGNVAPDAEVIPVASGNDPSSASSSVLPLKRERSFDPDDDHYRHPYGPRSSTDRERVGHDRDYDRDRERERDRDYMERDRIRERDLREQDHERERERERDRNRDYELDRDSRDRSYRERERERERDYGHDKHRDREYYYHQYHHRHSHHHHHGYPPRRHERGRYDRDDYSRDEGGYRYSRDRRDHPSRPYWDRGGASPDRGGERGSRSSSIDPGVRVHGDSGDSGPSSRAHDGEDSRSWSRRGSRSPSVNIDREGPRRAEGGNEDGIESGEIVDSRLPSRVEHGEGVPRQDFKIISASDSKRGSSGDGEEHEDGDDPNFDGIHGRKKLKVSTDAASPLV